MIGRSLVVLVLGLCACTPDPISTTSPAPAEAPAVETSQPTVIAEAEPAAEAEPTDDAATDERLAMQHGRINIEDIPLAQEDTVDHCARGRLDADRDLAAGLFAIETYGYPGDCQIAVARELGSTYQVEVRMLGCSISNRVVQHTACYNEVMATAIEAKHGAKIWDRARKHAGCKPHRVKRCQDTRCGRARRRERPQ